MRWEIGAPWPSLAEVEHRFDEILRSCWGGAVYSRTEPINGLG